VSARERPNASARVHPNVGHGLGIPFHDAAFAVDADERVMRRVDNISRVLALSSRRSPAPSVSATAAASRLATEMAKFCSSNVQTRGAAHMFGAEHAERATGLPQRDVEHRADSVRHQIASVKPDVRDRCGHRWRRSPVRLRGLESTADTLAEDRMPAPAGAGVPVVWYRLTHSISSVSLLSRHTLSRATSSVGRRRLQDRVPGDLRMTRRWKSIVR
jgi:hypothetical protein